MFEHVTAEHLLIWIAVGAGVGWLYEAVVKRNQRSGSADIVIGIFGGVAGAMVLSDIGLPFELWSMRLEQAVAALIGAVVVLVAAGIFSRFV